MRTPVVPVLLLLLLASADAIADARRTPHRVAALESLFGARSLTATATAAPETLASVAGATTTTTTTTLSAASAPPRSASSQPSAWQISLGAVAGISIAATLVAALIMASIFALCCCRGGLPKLNSNKRDGEHDSLVHDPSIPFEPTTTTPSSSLERTAYTPILSSKNPFSLLTAKARATKATLRYSAQMEGEIDLEIGDPVHVAEMLDGDYALGVNLRTKREAYTVSFNVTDMRWGRSTEGVRDGVPSVHRPCISSKGVELGPHTVRRMRFPSLFLAALAACASARPPFQRTSSDGDAAQGQSHLSSLKHHFGSSHHQPAAVADAHQQGESVAAQVQRISLLVASINRDTANHQGSKKADSPTLQQSPDTNANANNPSTPASAGLSAPAIAGIAIGCVAAVAVIGALVLNRNRIRPDGLTAIEGGKKPVTASRATTKARGEKYRAVSREFKPQREDELTLYIGDQVLLLEKHDDGWGRGRLMRNEGEGYFPLRCVGDVKNEILSVPSTTNTKYPHEILPTIHHNQFQKSVQKKGKSVSDETDIRVTNNPTRRAR
ncbi:hypothetical protein BC830DRAFT_1222375, partial [Chytriomyces sp. MP71]